MARRKADQDREWKVCKSNEIIQTARYDLSEQQQKVLLYLISKIKPTDTGTEEYTINVQDFCDAIGIHTNNGSESIAIKNAIKNLRDDSRWVRIGHEDVLLAWIDTATIPEGESEIKIRFSASIVPYLFELRSRYTTYKLHEALILKSKYSIRFYELMKSYAFGTNFENGTGTSKAYSPADIKSLLNADVYTRYANFKQKVLIPCLREVNSKSEEIHVQMDEYTTGRTVARVEFTVTPAPIKQRQEAQKLKQEGFKPKSRPQKSKVKTYE